MQKLIFFILSLCALSSHAQNQTSTSPSLLQIDTIQEQAETKQTIHKRKKATLTPKQEKHLLDQIIDFIIFGFLPLAIILILAEPYIRPYTEVYKKEKQAKELDLAKKVKREMAHREQVAALQKAFKEHTYKQNHAMGGYIIMPPKNASKPPFQSVDKHKRTQYKSDEHQRYRVLDKSNTAPFAEGFNKIRRVSSPEMLKQGFYLFVFSEKPVEEIEQPDMYAVHPNIQEAFRKFSQEKKNLNKLPQKKKDELDYPAYIDPFEDLVLLGVNIPDAYAISFGEKAAREAYKNKEWEDFGNLKNGFCGVPNNYNRKLCNEAISLGLNRLKHFFDKKLPYMVMGDLPDGDPNFGSTKYEPLKQ